MIVTKIDIKNNTFDILLFFLVCKKAVFVDFFELTMQTTPTFSNLQLKLNGKISYPGEGKIHNLSHKSQILCEFLFFLI